MYHSQSFARSNQGHKRSHPEVHRQGVSVSKDEQKIGIRFLRHGLGRTRFADRRFSARILEERTSFAYKCKRVTSCNFNSAESCKKGRQGASPGGQCSHLSLFQEGGEGCTSEQPSETIFTMVPRESDFSSDRIMPVSRHASRPIVKAIARQRRLLIKPRSLHFLK